MGANPHLLFIPLQWIQVDRFVTLLSFFLKKIALVKFSNEPGSEPLLAWKRASWVQETCLLIQAAVLRTASRLFHRGLRVCFKEDYEHLFDVPQHSRTDNDVSGLAPIYIPAAGR